MTVFTAVDIRATNPEAWTDWKARLLFDLRRNLTSPHAQGLRAVTRGAPRAQAAASTLDPALLAALSPRRLAKDLTDVGRAKVDLPPLVLRARGRTWVRFHRRVDKHGLFYDFVRHLFGFGLNVRLCFVHTTPELGAYDWFCLAGDRAPARVRQWMTAPAQPAPEVAGVTFARVELTATDQVEWTITCSGPDRRGLLVTAARVFCELGLSLRWARVHTWGGRVDDVFGVTPSGDPDDVIARLKARLTIASPPNG